MVEIGEVEKSNNKVCEIKALVDDTIPGFLLRKGFILGGLFDRIIRIRFSECGEYLVAACLPSGESAQSTLRPAR